MLLYWGIRAYNLLFSFFGQLWFICFFLCHFATIDIRFIAMVTLKITVYSCDHNSVSVHLLFYRPGQYATSTFPIMHFICPLPSPAKNMLHNLCFSFLLGITAVPREIENNAYAKFEEQIRCIMGDVKVAYCNFSRLFILLSFISWSF